MDRQKELSEQSIGKLLIKYSIPAIVGMLVNALYNVVDRIFIGNIKGIGALAITGVGITMPIVTVLFAFAMLMGIGGTANISIKLGQGKKEEAEKILGNAVSLGIIVGIILMIIGIVFADRLLMTFGGTPSTIPYGRAYIHIILLGTIFSVLGFGFTSMMRADGNPKMAAGTMIVGCLLNIVLDALFIFSFGMGIAGAALATIISQALTACIGIVYFTKGKSHLKLRKANLRLEKKWVKAIVAIGAAPFSMQIAVSLVQVIMNNVLRATGEEMAIGAMTAIVSIIMMVLMPIFGINQGAQPIIGYNYGAKNYKRSKKTALLSMGAASVILFLGFILIQSIPDTLIRMFDGEGTMARVAVPGLRLYSITVPIVGISIIGANYFQAIGKASKAMFLSLLRQVIILIPMILILSKTAGLTGIWLAQPISDFICTLVIISFLVKEFRSYKVAT